MDFKKFATDYFNFTLQERKGIWILLILLLAAIGMRLFFIFSPNEQSKLSLAFVALATDQDSFKNYGDSRIGNFAYSDWNQPDSVDPNFAPYRDLVAVGFSERLAKTIIKYRGSGGRFRRPTDLFKIHNFDSATYYKVKPYLQLPKSEEPSFAMASNNWNVSGNKGETKEYSLVEINKADTTELKGIRGIGSFLAKRIVDYRTKLGGFHTLTQLQEIWKLRPETYELIIQRMSLDSSLVSKIKVNSCTSVDLATHPYIGKRLADNMINYRNMHGNYKSWQSFEKLYFYKKENFEKLRPYLSLE